jgi:hypothetical protein
MSRRIKDLAKLWTFLDEIQEVPADVVVPEINLAAAVAASDY